MTASLYVGTASWAIPRPSAGRFPASGSQLERYASVLPAVEVNTSFYRPHRPATWARWAASTPDAFRFTVKLPRSISHAADLVAAAREHVAPFALASGTLGAKLGCLLVQLPPKRAFGDDARALVAMLCQTVAAPIALEPRHGTWFDGAADAFLADHGVARVAADPPRGPGSDTAAGSPRVAYYRLHGSPRIYYSPYGPARLAPWRERVLRSAAEAEAVYVIFDNTADGEATTDALWMRQALAGP